MKFQVVHKRTLYIWLTVLILVSVSAYYFWFMPLSTEISQKKDALEFTEKKYTLLKKEVEESESKALPVTSLLKSIPETMDEEGVIKMINLASNNSDTLIESYQYKGEETIEVNGEEVKQLTMQLNGSTSTINHLNSLIKQLETSDRLVHISGLYFQNREKLIHFQTEIKVYSKAFK